MQSFYLAGGGCEARAPTVSAPVQVLVGNYFMQTTNQAEWDNCKQINSDPYGSCAVRYTERWGNPHDYKFATRPDLSADAVCAGRRFFPLGGLLLIYEHTTKTKYILQN